MTLTLRLRKIRAEILADKQKDKAQMEQNGTTIIPSSSSEASSPCRGRIDRRWIRDDVIDPDTRKTKRLHTLMTNIESNTYVLHGDRRTYAVKVGSTYEKIMTEHDAQHAIRLGLQRWWCKVIGHLALEICKKKSSFKTASEEAAQRKIWYLQKKKLQIICVPKIAYKIAQGHTNSKMEFVGFGMQFVRPLSPEHIRALVNTFCDPSIRESMLSNPKLRNLRFHVHLGEMAPPNEAMSQKLARPVYFDQLFRAAPRRMVLWARQMGLALAIIHWKCQYDGAGIHFQLALHEARPVVILWMTNFGQCKTFNANIGPTLELSKAVANNPAWPKPPSAFKPERSPRARCTKNVWEAFKKAYILASCTLLGKDASPANAAKPAEVMAYVSLMAAPAGFKKAKRIAGLIMGDF
ncbi:hypothetical protein ACLX1H_008839 [Fusarium chlamydosporum]